METLENAILVLLSTMAVIIIYSLIGASFLYWGWNWGLIPALGSSSGLSEINFKTAFWLAILFSTMGGFFKSTSTSSTSNDTRS